jgi:hypothetical protein
VRREAGREYRSLYRLGHRHLATPMITFLLIFIILALPIPAAVALASV